MIADAAAAWAEQIAADDSHGYDQHNRWGPDYDCSSLVISAYRAAGVALQCTYTGNMYQDMIVKGFEDVTGKVNLNTGAGLQRGDVLLNVASHTAICCGGGMIVQASINEYGMTVGGASGDQNGREIAKRSYYLYSGGWDVVLRYAEKESGTTDRYTVQPGDSLWAIAEKVYGKTDILGGIEKLKRLNNIADGSIIYPGRSLKTQDEGTQDACEVKVPVLRRGATGLAVRMLQACLNERGAKCQITGDYEAQTEQAVMTFQAANGMDPDGIAGSGTWGKLLNN